MLVATILVQRLSLPALQAEVSLRIRDEIVKLPTVTANVWHIRDAPKRSLLKAGSLVFSVS